MAHIRHEALGAGETAFHATPDAAAQIAVRSASARSHIVRRASCHEQSATRAASKHNGTVSDAKQGARPVAMIPS